MAADSQYGLSLVVFVSVHMFYIPHMFRALAHHGMGPHDHDREGCW
jgi:hypothetical protein